MTNEQQKAIEEAANEMEISGFGRYCFEAGIEEVINNPSKYGLQPVNQWISVKERLPEKSCDVLAFNYKGGFIFQIIFDKEHNAFHDNVENWNEYISHWAPGMEWPTDVEPK